MGDGGRITSIGSVLAERRPFPFHPGAGLGAGAEGDHGEQRQPGPIDTGSDPADGDFAPVMIPLTAGRFASPAEELTGLIVYLALPRGWLRDGRDDRHRRRPHRLIRARRQAPSRGYPAGRPTTPRGRIRCSGASASAAAVQPAGVAPRPVRSTDGDLPPPTTRAGYPPPPDCAATPATLAPQPCDPNWHSSHWPPGGLHRPRRTGRRRGGHRRTHRTRLPGRPHRLHPRPLHHRPDQLANAPIRLAMVERVDGDRHPDHSGDLVADEHLASGLAGGSPARPHQWGRSWPRPARGPHALACLLSPCLCDHDILVDVTTRFHGRWSR